LYFYLTSPSQIKFEIFDLLGRKVLHNATLPEDSGYQSVSLDIHHLASGYYVLQLLQGDKRIGRKNVIVRH
jgi:hypothetical protein